MSHTHARASDDQVANRERFRDLLEQTPLPPHELLVNLPLYMRSSVVAKFLWIDEIYRLIVDVPGVVMEFGVWWGANQALFESLRAVYEPYNYTRRVIGFDTFEGYANVQEQDGDDEVLSAGRYGLGADSYPDYLREVLLAHQRENVMGHVDRSEIVVGDATETLTDYLERHPESLVSLAYFDMQLYEPTKRCLELVVPRMPRGAVLAMDELNCVEFPGETTAFLETVGLNRCRLVRSRFLPDRTYALID